MDKRPLIRYSEAFKRKVVREYEAGKSIEALRQRYGIGGYHTVQRWIKRYSKEGIRHQLMHIQDPSEREQLKQKEARIRELEQALAQQTLDCLMYRSLVELAEREYGFALKKTTANRPSATPTSGPKRRETP